MTKYIYKKNYDTPIFLKEIRKYVGESVTTVQCSSEGLIVINVDSSTKSDLDEYMNLNGFSYLCETTKTLVNAKNWGVLSTAELPTSNLNAGDWVYCSTTNKPLWWNGTAWVDALGN